MYELWNLEWLSTSMASSINILLCFAWLCNLLCIYNVTDFIHVHFVCSLPSDSATERPSIILPKVSYSKYTYLKSVHEQRQDWLVSISKTQHYRVSRSKITRRVNHLSSVRTVLSLRAMSRQKWVSQLSTCAGAGGTGEQPVRALPRRSDGGPIVPRASAYPIHHV